MSKRKLANIFKYTRGHLVRRSLHDLLKMNICTSEPVLATACVNSKTPRPILVKFGTDVKPFQDTQTSYFSLISDKNKDYL